MCFKSFRFFLCFSVVALFMAGAAIASDEKADNPTEKVSVGGYSFWQIGQIVKGWDKIADSISHQWQNNVLVGLTIKAQPSERLSVVVNPEFYLNYPNPQKPQQAQSVHPFGIAYINDAYGRFSFGDAENPFMQASLGMFAFKYNPDGRNFGDYLFRTGTYPTYIIDNFDFPAARLLGLHLSSDVVRNLHTDVLLTSEAFIFPLWDFSVTAIATYKLFNAVEIGAGVDFARCLPVMDSLTSPHFTTKNGAYYNSYITEGGDTAFYSFKATKVMTRASFDPKVIWKLLELPDIFGPEDMKLYGEICWVGVDGYSKAKYGFDSVNNTAIIPWYNSLNERTPRMVGFNWPTHPLLSYTLLPGIGTYYIANKKMVPTLIGAGTGIVSGVGLWLMEKYLGTKTGLDVLSCELEYFPSVIPNDYKAVEELLSPAPNLPENINSYDRNNHNKGFLRWSVYARKMIVQGFSVTGEAAFDHLRTTRVDGSTQQPESLTKAGDWHWNLKFGYSF